MITSKVLAKSYKTKAAYKAQITKYEKYCKEHLKDLQDCLKRGWNIYLGDPIRPQIRSYEMELLRIERERKINL